jgi:hypothetical protein
MPGRFDAPHQVGLCAGTQHVVDGLGGHRPQNLPHALRDLVGRGVRMSGKPLEDGHPWGGHPEAGCLESIP